MSALAILHEAAATGVTLRREGDLIRWSGKVTPEFVERLRAAKPEVLGVLAGDRCRGCGRTLAWPAPVGVIHGDGRASCFDCYYRGCAERVLARVTATSDEGELLHGDEP